MHTVSGHLRRSVSTAWQVGFANSASNSTPVVQAHSILVCIVGGFIAPFAFPASDAPKYHTGYSVCLAFLCMSVLANTIYCIMCAMENKKRAKESSEYVVGTDDAKGALGDLHPDYRYML